MQLFKKENSYWQFCPPAGGRGARWMNVMGGGHDAKPSDFDAGEFYKAESFDELDFSEALLVETLSSGWIDLEGNFWGCEYGRHEYLLSHVLKTPAYEAEDRGWLKINDHEPYWFNSGYPFKEGFKFNSANANQRKTLNKIGLSGVNQKYRNNDVSFREVFPDGYKSALLPVQNARSIDAQQAKAIAERMAPGFFIPPIRGPKGFDFI